MLAARERERDRIRIKELERENRMRRKEVTELAEMVWELKDELADRRGEIRGFYANGKIVTIVSPEDIRSGSGRESTEPEG